MQRSQKRCPHFGSMFTRNICCVKFVAEDCISPHFIQESSKSSSIWRKLMKEKRKERKGKKERRREMCFFFEEKNQAKFMLVSSIRTKKAKKRPFTFSRSSPPEVLFSFSPLPPLIWKKNHEWRQWIKNKGSLDKLFHNMFFFPTSFLWAFQYFPFHFATWQCSWWYLFPLFWINFGIKKFRWFSNICIKTHFVKGNVIITIWKVSLTLFFF